MDQPPVTFDLLRIFWGDITPGFLLEIVLRTGVVYTYTLVLIHWIGGRGVNQLSLVEFLLVIALGSAVGDAMFYPDVPLVSALAVITLVVLINKVLDLLILRSRRAKRLIDGVPVALVERGRLLPAGMAARDISAAEIIARLRGMGIRNLGEVEHMYLEAGGAFSMFRAAAPVAGLPIVPPAELAPPARLSEPAQAPGGMACCTRCGGLAPVAAVIPDGACPWCGHAHWTVPCRLPPPEDRG